MRPVFTYGRVRALGPGKHGPKDLRVEFNGVAPTHAELLAMFAAVFLAEDRYDGYGQLGRDMLFGRVLRIRNQVDSLDDAALHTILLETERDTA